MATHYHYPNAKSHDTQWDQREIAAPASPHGSADVPMFEKLQHFEYGYGEERDSEIVAQIKAERDNPNVHHSMNSRLAVSLLAMSFLWIGSQIPLYLYGSVIPHIYGEIGGADGRYVWMVIGYLIPVAAVCPFVGALSDMFGRKAVACTGQALLMIGPIVVSTATYINVAIGGMVICGLGAGLNELIALAGTSELVPVNRRALYVGGVVITILPFCPSPMWAQLITRDSTWRYNGLLIGIWNLVGFFLVLFFYEDPARQFQTRAKREVLREIDYIGGFLSTAGILCFMMGMQWGGTQYQWYQAQVIAPFVIGVVLIAAFFVWEIYFASYPMCPKSLFQKDTRTMAMILLITFFSGGNFFVMLLFWPTQCYNMYGNDPIGIGIRTLPIGFGIIFGAVFALFLIGLTRGRTQILMITWCIIMTAFVGAMSVANTTNLNSVVYPILTIACVAVGAVIIPCSIIAQIVAPTELIGTVTAITLSIRYIGGAVGFTAYYNVFFRKFHKYAIPAGFEIAAAGIDTNYTSIVEVITMAAQSEYAALREYVATNPNVMHKDIAYDFIIHQTQLAFVPTYRWPYWISIAFGGVCILCAFGLKDIRKFV